MLKTFRDKITLSGIIVLMIGVALLIFTFISAYGFLTQSLSILTSSDLASTFGATLAPLISTCIRIMYLGVMGWVSSLLTIRGVTIISQARQTPAVLTEEQTIVKETSQPAPKPKTEKSQAETKQPETKPESKAAPKPYEPEIVALTPEKVPQTQQKPQEPKQESQQNQTENK
jgi:hypothetical protein